MRMMQHSTRAPYGSKESSSSKSNHHNMDEETRDTVRTCWEHGGCDKKDYSVIPHLFSFRFCSKKTREELVIEIFKATYFCEWGPSTCTQPFDHLGEILKSEVRVEHIQVGKSLFVNSEIYEPSKERKSVNGNQH
mmetsp:Transcript_973/g.2097  ORF Transcript_973/g.2097 Transcript_973/m.2097 type:complete len:135 (-) Transcript_973:379-783(-)